MNKSVDRRFLVLAVLFGFLGGAASSLVLPRLAYAQGGAAEQVTARSFRVVDPEGRTLVLIDGRPDPDAPIIMRKGGDPEEFVGASMGSIQLFDSNGRVYWSFPRPLVHPLASGE